jgi:hypothetical protein
VHPLWHILSHSRRLPVLATITGGTQLHASAVRDAADRPGAPPGLQLCARCREVAYCSKDCQTQKWGSKHKKECAALRAGELTAHELKVIGKLMERFGAVDHRGVVDLKAEASEVAAVLACPPAATAGPTSPPRTRIRGSGNHNESQSAQYMRRAYAHATHFTRQSADIRPGQSRTRQCQP